MYKKQMLFQRIICIAMLIACAFCFLVSLGLITDVYDTVMPSFAFIYEDEAGFIESIDLMGNNYYCASYYYEFQDFNNQIVLMSLALIVISLTLFITCTNTRRKYYVGNYISTGMVAASSVFASIWAIFNITNFVNKYNMIEFDKLEEICKLMNMEFHRSAFSIQMGYVAFAILLIATALLVFNLIWKIIVMKNEQKALSIVEEVNHD